MDDSSGCGRSFLLILRGQDRIVAVGKVLNQILKILKNNREIAEKNIHIVRVFSRSYCCLLELKTL